MNIGNIKIFSYCSKSISTIFSITKQSKALLYIAPNGASLDLAKLTMKISYNEL